MSSAWLSDIMEMYEGIQCLISHLVRELQDAPLLQAAKTTWEHLQDFMEAQVYKKPAPLSFQFLP